MNEFKLLSEKSYAQPVEVTLPDGRIFRVHGIRTFYSHLTRSRFESARADWKLAGLWMNEIPLNGKVAIDLAAYMNELACTDCGTTVDRWDHEWDGDPNDPPAWLLDCDPERCANCGALLD